MQRLTRAFLRSGPPVLAAMTAILAGIAARGASPPALDAAAEPDWAWHVQTTGIAQGHPAFDAAYTGPNSLLPSSELKETLSFDLYTGVRLWPGAEAQVDGLAWQGFGVSDAVGAEAFPNGEAFRLGTNRPSAIVARGFLRQTFALGTEEEPVTGDALHLRGRLPVSRLTLTLGKFSVKDIFDNNAYANDPRTQFLNWAFMANEAWDYPADSLGFTTGLAAELNQRSWAARYGVFQVPRVSNGLPSDSHLLRAWGMVVELERRYRLGGHDGRVRVLGYHNRAHMGSYQAALDATVRPADIAATRAYRGKTGFGLNLEQEIAPHAGLFSRLGWSDGRNEAWSFADVDRTATLGVSVDGAGWGRAGDTVGLANVWNEISAAHRRFLAAGGTGILAGDGTLRYGPERLLETYYDAQLDRFVRVAFDFQYLSHPAYNRDRGPVPVFAVRVHAEY